MNQFFIANPKGGCGKTTIATHLAAYFANHGVRVLLVDHDAQKSSSDWLKNRPANYSSIDLLVSSANEPTPTESARLIIHDMPAAWTLENVSNVLHPGDRVIIPVLPSPTDIKACLRYVMGLHRFGVIEYGINIGFVANRVRTKTRFYQVLVEFLSRLQLPVIGELRDTQNYVRIMDKGLSIFDTPSSRIATDFNQWQSILDWLESDIIVRDFASATSSPVNSISTPNIPTEAFIKPA